MFLKPLLFLIWLHESLNFVELSSIIVNTSNGPLEGLEKPDFFSFEGIPYAEKPVGSLRFEPPVPITQQWKEPLQAFAPQQPCLQRDHLVFDGDQVRGSEDCLYLNVYVPKTRTSLLPVIVHIHGGRLLFGSGDFYGPEFILKRSQSFVFVSLNYRLGPLGFLASGDGSIRGNMGMKDQVLALKWVRDNIESFGGDRNKVLLTGFSAGGASVQFHYFSKQSQGLFAAGISHSGFALNPWMVTTDVKERFQHVAALLNCSNEDTRRSADCVRETPAEEVVRTVPKFEDMFFAPAEDKVSFSVVVEPRSEDAFLDDSIVSLIEKNEFSKVPWLTSVTEADGLYPLALCLRIENCFDRLEAEWSSVSLGFHSETSASEKIRSEYLGGSRISEESFSNLTRLYTDRYYTYDLGRVIKLLQSRIPVFVYVYKFKAQYGFGELLSNKTGKTGVGHGDDMVLLYKTPLRNAVPLSLEEEDMGITLLEIYESFINEGTPQIGFVKAKKVSGEDTLSYLSIEDPDHVSEVEMDFEEFGNWEFWSNL